jgi:hypothetical protein
MQQTLLMNAAEACSASLEKKGFNAGLGVVQMKLKQQSG